jgi:hypothetical protein
MPPTVRKALPAPVAADADPGATLRMQTCKSLHYSKLRLYTAKVQLNGIGTRDAATHFRSIWT